MLQEEIEQLNLEMELANISSSNKLDMQTTITNWRRRISVVICKLSIDDKFSTKEIIVATRNQWRVKGEATPMDNKKFLFSFDS